MQILHCNTQTQIFKFLGCVLMLISFNLSAQSYTVSQTGTYNIEIVDPTYFDAFGDEITQIPIGFNFTFFGNTYTDCYVGGDGFVTFSSDAATYCCGQTLPDPNLPNNLIAAAWSNMDFVSTHYEVFGTAPYRRLVITFDLANPCDETYYGQVKLYETTNVIEIHTQEWSQSQCQGGSTQGLENIDGTEGIPVPGRNFNADWTVSNGDNDFVSFTPNAGGPVTYVLSQTGTYNIEINDPTYFDIFGDAVTEIPIGFNFNFFGTSYSNCFVGGDGFITFGGDPGSGYCCGQYIPDAAVPNNLIAAGWSNMDNGNAHYEIFGTSPFRRLVITLDLRNPCDEVYYGQVKLFETTNVIEIHTQEWDQNQCQGYLATQGIENSDGTAAYPVPGRNYNDVWTVSNGSNDFVSFTPMGGSSNVVYIVDRPNDFDLEFDTPVQDTVVDDGFVNVPIGFDFLFYGTSYSTCYLYQNGFLSFNITDNGCCEGQSIPDPSGPNNMIAAGWINGTSDDCCWQGQGYDIFSHETIGTAPNRRFVAYFLAPESCGQYYRGEIKLFEGSNIIEIHTDQWAAYNTPCYNATQGIENSDGTQAYYYTGRNANTDWSVIQGSNDVVRFTPTTALPAADAGVIGITHIGFCTGSQPMSARIKNFGGNPIDSVDIEWQFDGIPQTPVHFVGTIPVAGDTLLDLGYQTLVSGQDYYLKAWTNLPNNESDGNNSNDTLATFIHSSMAGTYTIGGSNPDYATFNDAVADLSLLGVCDTVIMNVRPGTYTEQLVIPYIAGSNGKRITFRAENGDSTSVILQYTATAGNANYVVRLDSTTAIVLDRMTLKALGTNFARVIEWKDNTHDNIIQHCAINGRNAVVSTTAYACIYSDAHNYNNKVISNTLKNGSYGFFHLFDVSAGGGSLPPDSIELTGNSFIDFYNKAINTDHTKTLRIHHNIIQSTKSNVRGIEVVNDNGALSIAFNSIYLPTPNAGMSIADVNPLASVRAKVYNNMINLPGGTPVVGFGIYNSNKMNIYHNTVRTAGPYGYYVFVHQGGGQDSVYNNIFANTGNGPVIYSSGSISNSFDYNDLWTAGSFFGEFVSTFNDAANIVQWRQYSGFDIHSVSVNPYFISSTDLHVTNDLLNGIGSPLVSTPLDIDGGVRNSIHPDLGADEFTPSMTDAGLTGLLSPTLSCNAEQNIEVVLSNLGTDTLHNVIIKWTLNGIPQSDVNYTQALSPEGDTAHVVLSVHTFSNLPDSIRIWTSSPNGITDQQQGNDTLAFRYRLPLNGIYTIGGTTPDFITFKKAVTDLNKFKTCGPVAFRFRDGVYNEQVIIDSISTTSAVNTITFESESGDSSMVTIQNTNDNVHPAVVLLAGTDYVTFRHLGIKALPSGYADGIEMRYSATHNTVSHCKVEGYSFANGSGILIKSLNFGGLNDYLTVDHNYLLSGLQGLYLFNDHKQHEIKIENNAFVNQRYYGNYITNTTGLYILNNTFSTNTTNGYTGINQNSADGITEISGNSFDLLNPGDGMFLNSINYSTNSGTGKVYNNMVKSPGNGNGIRLWNSENVYVSYNNCNITGSGIAFELVGGDSAYVKNNVFVSNTGKAYSSSISVTPHLVSDYNDLYSVSGNVGDWNGTTYQTLSQWQTGTGYDLNSISITPQFVAPNNLHVLADTLDGAGIPIAGISIDFDGNPRNATTPDIGADEIGANSNDAGIFTIFPKMPFARGMQNVKAVIRNYGGNTITSAEIHWKLNNVAQATFNFTGSLPTLQQDTVILGQVNFALSTPYIIKTWTAQPNGIDDLYNINDTLTTSTLYAAVSDTLTIGGIIPDLVNFSDALTALSLGGVLDSVHFQIRNGTYHALLAIPQTIGMSCNTPIIFESESGNASNVIWDNMSLAGTTLILNGADGITFKNLTIKTVQAPYRAVEFSGGATCNTFLQCQLEGVTTTSSSTAQSIVLSTSSQDHNNHFINNTFTNGAYGLYWDGGGATTGAIIDNNIFQNAYYGGLTVSQLGAPLISRNTITSNTAYNYYTGINVNSCSDNTKIDANQILLSGKRGIGLSIYACYGTAALPLLASNNFIILGNGTISYGIQHVYGNYNNIYNNTVRINGGDNTGLAYRLIYGTNYNLRNNIFENSAGGYSMLLSGNYGSSTSDYNDFTSSGANIVNRDGVQYPDITAWKLTGNDAHGVSEDPMFSTTTGYHITNAALNATAQHLADVPKDIESETRDPLTPDIGCDEIALYNNDVGILSINYPKEPFPSGVNTVFIKFVNNGQDTLTSMQVDWEVDGIPQPTYAWTGLLPSAATYDSLDIGEYNFAPYQTHTIKAWVSLPNTQADELASNDTLQVNNLYPGLLGTYTIGGTNPDFDSLVTAVNVLNLGGAAGPVTFNIRTGTYLEALTINDFPGSDCDNPVIFKSETGDSSSVTITNLGINQTTITLNGADGVIFKNLTIESVNPAFRNAIKYYNGAHCNQFLNNHIKGVESNSTDINHAVIISPNTLDTANVIKNNWIQFGAVGIYVESNGEPTNTLIQHNFLDRNQYIGIFASVESGIKILQNTVSGGIGYPYYEGVSLQYCYGPVRIESNNIHAELGRYGLHIESCTASSNERGRIINNFSSIEGTTETYGLLFDNSQYYDILYNNVNVHSTVNSFALYFYNGTSNHTINNIFSNSGPGYCVLENNQTDLISNHNDFHFTGAFGIWNGAGISDLANWQSTTSQDPNSLSVNPQFMSDANLHVSNVLLNGSGQTIPSVTTDIDGNTRNNPPDIGADEFNPSIPNDAGIFSYFGPHAPFPSGSNPVQVTLKNYGSNLLTSADIRWLVNGVEQPVYHWTGSLPTAVCDTVIIGNFNFAPHSDHDLIFWSQSPNGVADSTHVNDTLATNNIYPGLIGTYTIGGILPDFNLFSQVEEALNNGGLLGDVTFNIRNGTYSTQLLINDFQRLNANDSVTFQSEQGDSSLVTIERNFYNPYNNYIVRLSNTHHITFQHISFSTNQGHGLEIDNGSSDITVDHCLFTAPQLMYDDNTFIHIYSSTTSEDTLTIANNQFNKGSIGIQLTASWGDLEKNVSVLNNHFNNCFYRSIDVAFDDGLLLKGNTTYNTNINVYQAVSVVASVNVKEISKNDIRMLGGGNCGLYLQSVYGTAMSPTNISNNYILVRNGSYNQVGIAHSYGDYNNFNYNTVRIENAGPGSVAFTDYASLNHIHLRNCNFANYSGGLTIYNTWYPNYTTNTMDYCNLYTTGPILAQYSGVYANLAALQAGESQNLHGKSAEPLFSDYSPSVFQAALDGTAIPISGVTTDIYDTPRNASTPDIGAKEFTLLPHDIGAKLLVSPATYCGLSNAEVVTMQIQNYGATTETGFNVAYKRDASSWTVENVGALSVVPGGILNYTFTPTENLSQPGTYTFSLYTSLNTDQNIHNDTVLNISVEHIPALVSPVSNMIPTDGTMNLESTVSLSWAPAPNANRYDIYLWPFEGTQPATPQVSDLTQINTLYYSLSYGTTYKWRVVAKNVCNQMVSGPIQQFTVRKLPEIVVDTVIAPLTAFSGQTIQMEWVVRNSGPGATQSTLWSDAVYLSTDATLNTSFDTYLGAVQNLIALDSAMAYTNTGTFTVPQGFSGNYYVFVYADRWNSINEISNNNNWRRSPTPMMVSLTPSPDLIVQSVTTPTTVFSGATMPVTYHVKNDGLGPVPSSAVWSDRIVLSQDPLNPIGPNLGLVSRSFALDVDSTYTVTQNVQLPPAISGTYYMHVITDSQNSIYEFGAEDNNSNASLPINVILAPPADLTVSQVTFPDTVSNNELIPFSWVVNNQGAGAADVQYWLDEASLSLSPVYNTNFLIPFTYGYKSGPVIPFSNYTLSPGVLIQQYLSGYYYVYLFTDKNNNVFENTNETNNIYKAPTQIYVANADLKNANLAAPDTTDFGSNIQFNWKIINDGPGKLINKYYYNKIYLSTQDTLNPQSVLLYTSPYNTINLQVHDTISRSASLQLPPGYTGQYFLLVVADANNIVYEGTNENNNLSSRPIFLEPGPAPDIITTSITVPDTITAGMSAQISYHFTNMGNDTVSQNWIDKIYFSFDSIWHPLNAIELKTANQTTGLLPGISRTTDLPVIIPQNATENFYYIYVVNDQNALVFEGVPGELNNVKRSSAIYIKAAPPIDLSLDNISITSGSSIFTGINYPFQWTTKNVGVSTTLTNAWNDRIYLSTDTIYQAGVDILITDLASNGPLLAPGQNRLRQQSLMIPNGLSGSYYIIGITDALDVHYDVNRNNNTNKVRDINGMPLLFNVVLSPYPDLKVTLFNTPASTIAGQPLQVIYTITNSGNGSASTWIDKMYLSADNIINNADLILLSNNRVTLAAGNSINDTVDVQVPVGYFGNYILIMQTDANNQLYEHNGENNNILTRSINIINPPPSDLKVANVIVPVNVIAGDNINISWTTQNIGSNPASGVFREVVYISPDSVWNTQDVVFGIKDQTVYLPPAGHIDQQLTDNVTGVATGDYYAIVQTDARQNFNESNETNNFTASSDIMNVDVKTLYLDSLTADSLHDNLELYYKIDVGPELDGETILLDLKGDSLYGLNELYVKYNQMPTRADFDFGFDHPFQSDQRIIIPNVHPGTYYILAYGFTLNQSVQDITLYAKVIDYEILSLSPKHGIKNTQVTLKITGSKLNNTMQWRLRQSDPWFSRDAISSYIVDDNLAFVTFDLTDMAVDTYAVDLIKPDSSLAFIDDFMVDADGSQPKLQINAQLPGGVPGRAVPIQIVLTFINNGDADVINPSIRVEAPYGNKITNTLEELMAGMGEPVLIVPLVEENGPPGVIRPGASGRIEIYASSGPSAVYGIRIND